ncbi:L,D-transpeptidase [Mesorhizobium sp. Mes31]|uniref:L,D-transpeptidase n=1 Tax=Mesorhizobium sp. Mes31 TaxID=2926017 RepID=UPI002118A2FE|nr:L,D-transpeptidase [Mesorhizobium sp. Mes31]
MKTHFLMGRRQFLLGATGLAAAAAAGCTTTPPLAFAADTRPAPRPDFATMYAAIPDEQFPVPAARIDLIDPEYYRQVVRDPTGERPGTIVVDTPKRFLYLVQYRHGMSPGLDNPLGARALYIFEDGKDTLYRLHGNMDARSIGHAVSSGCVRLLFQDVIDLYERVPLGASIHVLQAEGSANA